jgi:HSP20 family protein
MFLERYNPFRNKLRKRESMPRVWDEDFFDRLWRGFDDLYLDSPRIEVKEQKDKYLIRAEMPGFEKDEVNAQVEDGMLRLRAQHKDEKWDQDEEKGWRSIETRAGSFYRTVPLPEDVVTEKIKADMKNGVLRLTLPRDPAKAKSGKEIEIR